MFRSSQERSSSIVRMGAVDKNALSTAAVLGLRTDLKLSGTEYSCE